MSSAKSTLDSLLIPPEQLKAAKRWSPGQLDTRSSPGSARANTRESPHALQQAAETRARQAALLKAREDGFAAGFADGRALAEHEARRLSQVAASMEAAIAGLEHSVADQLLDLAIDLARAVLRHELTVRPEALRELVQEAMRALPESIAGGEIQVHPSDVDLVKDYLRDAGYNGGWRVVADARIDAGGCRIATRACDIDGTLRTRWEHLMHSLGRSDAWKSADPNG